VATTARVDPDAPVRVDERSSSRFVCRHKTIPFLDYEIENVAISVN
jgi:hypothetical protein